MHIVAAKQMYELDRYTMEELGLDGKILMENAGIAISRKVESIITKSDKVLILIGSGNNGGDGFVIARTLLNQGYYPTVLQLVPDVKITGDAAYHKQLFIRFGGYIKQAESLEEVSSFLDESNVIIDAILGIGITGMLRSPMKEIVHAVNQSDAITISVDIPSGVPANEGVTEFEGVKADYTFVVEEPKVSAFLPSTSPYYGKWEVVKIGLPSSGYSYTAKVWMDDDVRRTIPRRGANSHKGNHGKGLIIGGSLEMPGSIAMTTSAALRAGSGLITVGTIRESIPVVASQCAEATYMNLQSCQGSISNKQKVDVSNFDAIAIGMGMGRKEESQEFTRKIISDVKVPVLIDADGLHHVRHDLSIIKKRSYPTVLTPHPGEMAALTGKSVQEIITNPFSISKEFAQEYKVYLILKGSYTIISDPDGNQWVNATGNAGLAKGGSGDVLSGILLSMIMQSKSLQEALLNGCYIHGKSADILVENQHSQEDLLATDVIKGLASVFRTFV